jgi:alkylated DNA repair dioxygenase AlkB
LTDLDIYRKWNDDPGLLDALRGLFTYDPDGRGNGWLYIEGGQEWPPSLIGAGTRLLVDLEQLLGVWFTVVVFQAYRDGSGVGWHADEGYDVQAILSLGVTRTFGTRRPDGDPVWIRVGHGDLMVMPSGFQSEWQHCVPVEDVVGERCSLVFRAVRGGSS